MHVKQPNPRSENAHDVRHPYQQFQDTFRQVFKVFRRELGTSGSVKPRQSSPKFSEVMDALIACSPNFCNMRQLRIDTWDLPPTYDIQPLFRSFWSSFGSNLRHLSLGGNLEGYKLFIETKPNLPALIDLEVEFTNNVYRINQDLDAAILVDVVAPFIDRLGHHIESLRVWSWAALDLSQFFMRLTAFPRLKYLDIRMAFNVTLQQDASGLKSLLSASSGSLQRLNLRLNPSGWPTDPMREESLSQWLSSCLSDEKCFSQLHVLDIYCKAAPYMCVSVCTRSSLLRSDLRFRRSSFFLSLSSILGIHSRISKITRRFCSFGSNVSSLFLPSVSRLCGFPYIRQLFQLVWTSFYPS
jgi:hypothetical protein